MSIFSQTRRSLLSPKFVLLAQQRFCIRENAANYHVKSTMNQPEHKSLLPISELDFRNYNPMRCFNDSNVFILNHHKSYSKLISQIKCQLSVQGHLGKQQQDHRKSSSTDDDNGYLFDHNIKANDHNFRNKFNSGALVPMLGVLGLFRGMTTDDVENEKAKLTDEQKMKKMKPIELMIARGVLAMCDQEYSKADGFFHNAIHIAQDENDEEQEMLILNLLASNYFESGDFERAEKLFIDIMTRLTNNGVEATNPAILELSLKLASIYSKNKASHDKALKGFKFVINNLLLNLQDILNTPGELEIQELSEEKKNELALLGWSFDWFAKHLLAVNDFSGAADMLQRALQISSKILGPLHDQTLILLNDVGTTLAMNDSPKEGRTFIRKAVEGAIESQSNELASFYVNLGLVELKLKRLSKAKRYCEYSIELASKNRDHHNSHEVIELSRSCLNELSRLLENEDH